MGGGSLSCLIDFHSIMPKYDENYGGAKYSNATVTRDCESVETRQREAQVLGEEKRGFVWEARLSETLRGKFFNCYLENAETLVVSKSASRYLACIAMLFDLYECLYDVIEFDYGDLQVDCVIERAFRKKNEFESELYRLFNQSVGEELDGVMSEQMKVES
jgi:hypothetical protein